MTELSDLQKLVKAELESGHCQQTRAILESLPSFEEKLHFIKAIDAKIREETRADENLPMISLQAKPMIMEPQREFSQLCSRVVF